MRVVEREATQALLDKLPHCSCGAVARYRLVDGSDVCRTCCSEDDETAIEMDFPWARRAAALQQSFEQTAAAAMSIDEMMAAIEQRCCLRCLWCCKAGWGMRFVRPYAQVEFEDRRDDETFLQHMARADEAQQQELQRSRENEVTHHYYPTLEACVRAEYEERVVKGAAP